MIEANALYRWSTIYLPFGLNYSLPTFEPAGNSTSTIEAKGAIGAQLGIGFFINEAFHIELLSQSIQARVTVTNSVGTGDLGTGTLSGMVFRAGYSF